MQAADQKNSHQSQTALSNDQAPEKSTQKNSANKEYNDLSRKLAGRNASKAREAFRTISEVADLLDVQQHVLRFWETKFTQVKPLKRGGGRRYYRPEDVAVLKHIHRLLYTEGYTIKGAQKLLKGQGRGQIAAKLDKPSQEGAIDAKARFENDQPQTQAKSKISDNQRAILNVMLDELKAMRAMLNA